MTSPLFQKLTAAEAEFKACDATDFDRFFELLNAWEAAEREYNEAVSHAAAAWDRLPSGWRKDSAEDNAHDTTGTVEDRLYWYQIAICGYDL